MEARATLPGVVFAVVVVVVVVVNVVVVDRPATPHRLAAIRPMRPVGRRTMRRHAERSTTTTTTITTTTTTTTGPEPRAL